MNIFKFIRSTFSAKYGGIYFVESIQKSYNNHKMMFPGYDQHFYLAQAWTALMKAKGVDLDEGSLSNAAFTTTYLVACIPDPECARALGIFMLFRERPEVIQQLPDLEAEFNDLIEPVNIAKEAGEIDTLYQRFNPQMSQEQGAHP